MAKGSSRSTADVDGRSGGCVGEYRRSGGRPLPGGTTGTEDPNLAVPGDLSDPPGTYGEPVAVKDGGFGKRSGETGRSKDRNRAPDRLHNAHRPHRSLHQRPPTGATPPLSGAIIRPLRRNRLGGLIHEYVLSHDVTGFSAPTGSGVRRADQDAQRLCQHHGYGRHPTSHLAHHRRPQFRTTFDSTPRSGNVRDLH